MTLPAAQRPSRLPALPGWFDPAVALVAAGCVVLVLGGAWVYPSFLSANYLLQQLQMASFLGIIATGATLVILLGEIDLSVPWTITSVAIVATQFAGSRNPVVADLAVPIGLAAGALIGLINGVGVAVFRIPAMVWTLAVNAMLLGATVFYTGGFKPQGVVPPVATVAALGRTLGLPHAFIVWAVIAAATVWLLRRTVYGVYVYAMGNSQRALFMAGAKIRRVTIVTFVLAGTLSSVGALLLTGYANQAYQGMGDPYLMPVIAAVVIGGTSILGGSGNYLGTVAGAIFITLLSSILSVLQVDEAIRQIIFGAIILGMLLTQRLRRE